MNKALDNNEKAMNKRDLEWMGWVKKGWVLGGLGFWRRIVLKRVLKLGFSYTLAHWSPNMFLPIYGFNINHWINMFVISNGGCTFV